LFSRGWKISDQDKGVTPSFATPTEDPGAGGLSIQVDGKYAIEYAVPAHLTLADRLKLAIRYTPSTMFFTGLFVTSKDKSQGDWRWIKYYIGDKPPEQTHGYPKEHTVWVRPQHLANGWVSLDLNLPEIVREAIGGEGWVYNSIKAIRLRGSVSISPIKFYAASEGEVA
jgi:hypothetical protein